MTFVHGFLSYFFIIMSRSVFFKILFQVRSCLQVVHLRTNFHVVQYFFPLFFQGWGGGYSNSYLILCVCVLKGIFILFYFSRILNFVYKMCVEPSLQPLRLSPLQLRILFLLNGNRKGYRPSVLIVCFCFFFLSCLMEIGRGDCRVPRGSFVPRPS